jgi:membrane protein DedA with SNARE-associated domain
MDKLVDFLTNFSGPTPYLLVFGLLILCGLGLPMPEDIILCAAGLLAYYQVADAKLMTLISMIGVLGGDGFIFFLGHRYGPRMYQKKFFMKILPPARLDLVKKKIHSQGNKVIFFARFMPGLRMPVYFCAGVLHLPARTFLLYDGFAALISVPTIIFAVYHFGDHLDRVMKIIKKVQFGIVGLIAAIIIFVCMKMYLEHKQLQKEEAQYEKNPKGE